MKAKRDEYGIFKCSKCGFKYVASKSFANCGCFFCSVFNYDKPLRKKQEEEEIETVDAVVVDSLPE